jgi:acetylornithine aminotransferase
MELFDVYPLFPINIVEGKGCRVWDEDGQEYLDLYGGHAVISIGHCHPVYVNALSDQLQKLGFYSNSVQNSLQKRLAQKLGEVCGYEDYQLFLVNSGAEANENAMKLASFHNGRTRILSFEKAFHGRTSLAVEATANPKIIAPINANNHVTYLPLNDIEAWKAELQKGDVCACIIECIQGVGGIRMVTPEFYRQLRQLCTETGTVLICDEIQCGYGRSGKFFAHQHLFGPQKELAPDMITVAKGICNGFPMSGLLISPRFAPVYGQLGTTFGGNHLACAGALAVLEVIEQEGLVENARVVGEYLIKELQGMVGGKVVEVRGTGLMIGIELSEPYKEIRNRLLFEEHCFTGCAGTHTIRLLPPLCLTMEEAKEFIKKFRRVL